MKNVGAIMIDKLPTVDLRVLELMAIQQVYDDNKGITRKQAAKLLGMSERTLYRKILDNGLPVGVATDPQKYYIYNATDGIPCDFDREYDTVKEAEDRIAEMREMFRKIQGYYKTSYGERIDPDDIQYEIRTV